MPEAAVAGRVLFDATGGFSAVRGVHETNEPRQLNLFIRQAGAAHRLSVQTTDPVLVRAFGDNVDCLLPVTTDRLRGLVQACRTAWRTHAVDRTVRGRGKVFQRYWDFADAPGHLDAVLRPLAEAGVDLFLAIFLPDRDDDAPDVAVRQHIFDVLREHSADRDLWIKITSASFFAPWNMIYPKRLRSGDEPDRTAFWGYRHVIEHVPRDSGGLAHELAQPGTGPLELGIHIDRDIDTTLKVACLAPVLDHFDGYRADRLLRHRREEKQSLRDELSSTPDDHVLYFCCHASQEGDQREILDAPARLRLSDPPEAGWITPADLSRWLDDGRLERHPVVFLNACATGQFTSAFYHGFARTFLSMGASAVIGPQTDLPAVLGGEFARRFFERFFAGGPQNKIGHVLADLRRELLDTHHNPLGLLYSLYRGGDTHLEFPVR